MRVREGRIARAADSRFRSTERKWTVRAINYFQQSDRRERERREREEGREDVSCSPWNASVELGLEQHAVRTALRNSGLVVGGRFKPGRAIRVIAGSEFRDRRSAAISDRERKKLNR